jgi:hypothetical protein
MASDRVDNESLAIAGLSCVAPGGFRPLQNRHPLTLGTIAVIGSLLVLGAGTLAILLEISENREPKSGIRGVLRVGCPGDRPCGWFGKGASQDVFMPVVRSA